MNLLIHTFPLEGKTLYYVSCLECKSNRILNSTANVSNMVSKEAFQKLCGCICKHKLNSPKVEKPKQSRKSLSAIINGKEMTVKQIADAYALSPSTIRQRIHTGKTGFDLIAPTTRNSKKSRVN